MDKNPIRKQNIHFPDFFFNLWEKQLPVYQARVYPRPDYTPGDVHSGRLHQYWIT